MSQLNASGRKGKIGLTTGFWKFRSQIPSGILTGKCRFILKYSYSLIRMDLTVVSNLVIDTIIGNDGVISPSMGGPPCYGGLMAVELGLCTNLVTRFGNDLKDEERETLKNRGLSLKPSGVSELPTTKFSIECLGQHRTLFLRSKCDKIRLEDVLDTRTDGWLVSPVYDEVPELVLNYIMKNTGDRNFVMLDPQGYTRAVDDKGMISIKNEINLDLKGVTAIKLDAVELECLTGGISGPSGIRKVHDRYGIHFVIYTEETAIHVSDGGTHYWLPLSKKNAPDSTGIGDILSSTFACTFLKEKDLIWAFCFAVGATTASLESKNRGLRKIPTSSKVEENASYFYNMLNFARL